MLRQIKIFADSEKVHENTRQKKEEFKCTGKAGFYGNYFWLNIFPDYAKKMSGHFVTPKNVRPVLWRTIYKMFFFQPPYHTCLLYLYMPA